MLAAASQCCTFTWQNFMRCWTVNMTKPENKHKAIATMISAVKTSVSFHYLQSHKPAGKDVIAQRPWSHIFLFYCPCGCRRLAVILMPWGCYLIYKASETMSLCLTSHPLWTALGIWYFILFSIPFLQVLQDTYRLLAQLPALPYSLRKGSMHSASKAMPAALGCSASGIKSGDNCIANAHISHHLFKRWTWAR